MKFNPKGKKMEVWKTVLGYKDSYEVSNFGRIRGLERMCYAGRGHFRCVKAKILKPRTDGHGYFAVNLYDDNGPKTHKVARLVLDAFIGLCPEGLESCHNDGVRQNDRLENLRWDTRLSNARDRITHGTTTRGELDATNKLAEADVVKIKKALLADGSKGQGRKLARQFGVSEAIISMIRSGKRWGWHFWGDKGGTPKDIVRFRKLSRLDVFKIKAAFKKGGFLSQNQQLAEKFDISESAIGDIRTGKNWGWLKICEG